MLVSRKKVNVMEFYFLGTNAGVPTIQRNVTSIALRLLEERRSMWLFDCGEGTQQEVLRSPLKLSRLEKYLSPICMGIIFLVCRGCCRAERTRGNDTTDGIWTAWNPAIYRAIFRDQPIAYQLPTTYCGAYGRGSV